MAHIKFVSTRKISLKKLNRFAPPACRRCGENCTCSEEEIDSGGPA